MIVIRDCYLKNLRTNELKLHIFMFNGKLTYSQTMLQPGTNYEELTKGHPEGLF